MSADDAARQEAERRYRRQTMHIGTAQDREKAAFEAGAQWQRERPVTDAEVEAAARAWAAASPAGPGGFESMSKHRQELLLVRLRAALEAAKGASND